MEKLFVSGGSIGLRFPEGSNGEGWGSLVEAGQRVGPYVNFVGSQTPPGGSNHREVLLPEVWLFRCR